MILLNYDHSEISPVGGGWGEIIPHEAQPWYERFFLFKEMPPLARMELRVKSVVNISGPMNNRGL